MINQYVIITPAHNEESYIRFTLESVVNQTLLPEQWIIVDDGSIDGTADIVRSYINNFPWIKLVTNPTIGDKPEGGSKIVQAFYHGYREVEVSDFEFVVKLDADLTLPTQYFEEVSNTFSADPTVGMCGGFLTEYSAGKWKKASSAKYHLRGAIKAYRKECFDQIGGIPISLIWDGIDEMKAMSLGWKVEILDLEVKHHRKGSTIINRGFSSSRNAGKQYYKHGYDLFLAFCRSVTYGMRTKPYFLTTFGFLSGYFSDWWKKSSKSVTPELETFIRKFQYNRIKNTLFGAKNRGD
jgi:glycosyltransferase involved in cell wall biosynthesis